MTTKKALVLLSGGQDSATCLAIALETYPNPGEVMAICFDYGQRHRIELDLAKKIAEIAAIPLQIIDATWIATLSPNALVDASIPISENEKGTPPSTFVEGRNLFFLSIGAVIAKINKIQHLYTGVCETDFSGYPDCRNDFITSLTKTLSLGLGYPLTIVTPLMWKTKSQTVQLMQKMNKLDWYTFTHTCYLGKRPACGSCPACILRLKGFEEAGVKDPIDYL